MNELALVVSAGLLAGSVHVVTGPDHIAAVLPLAVRAPHRALRTGALWGLGHGLGVVALLVLAQLLRGAFDLSSVSEFAEVAVGLMLIYVGGRALRSRSLTHEASGANRTAKSAAAFGVLHGMAGASHLVAAVPGVVVEGELVVAYAATYLLASVALMALFTAGVGRLFPESKHQAKLLRITGAVAIAVGVVWCLLGLKTLV